MTTPSAWRKWATQTLLPECELYAGRRQQARRNDDDVKRQIHFHTSVALTDKAHRHTLAQLISGVVDRDMPLERVVEQLDGVEVRDIATGVAAYWMPRVWDAVKTEAKSELRQPHRQQLLEAVTIDNFKDQQLIREKFDLESPEFQFLLLLGVQCTSRSRLRHLPARDAMLPTDTEQALDWTLDFEEVQRRVTDVAERLQELKHDFTHRFFSEKTKHEAMWPYNVEEVANRLKFFADVPGFHDETIIRDQVRTNTTAALDTLLRDLDATSQSEFRLRLDSAPSLFRTVVPSPERPLLLLPVVLATNAGDIQTLLRREREAYNALVEPIRHQWNNVEEALESVDALWTQADDAVAKEVHAGQVAFREAYPAEWESEQWSYFSVYTDQAIKWREHMQSVSELHCMKQVHQELLAAMQPTSAMARMTRRHPWREEVLKVRKAFTVELPDEVMAWVARMQLAQRATTVEARQRMQQDWDARLASLAQALHRAAKIMAHKCAAWHSTGEPRLAHEVYEKRLLLLRTPPVGDKILWQQCWSELAKDWRLRQSCWNKEERAAFHRACTEQTVLISWAEVQRCVLMMRWEELAAC